GFVALACALYLAAGISATWPAVLHARSHFLSGGAPGHGEAAPGDHLQTLYHWWLVGHQLEGGHTPWLDPYSFRPEAAAQPHGAGTNGGSSSRGLRSRRYRSPARCISPSARSRSSSPTHSSASGGSGHMQPHASRPPPGPGSSSGRR